AFHFRANHSVGRIRLRFHRRLVRWSIKTWPARSRMVFRFRSKQRLPAADAFVGPRRLRIFVFSGKWWLGPFLPGHVILIRGELLLPLFLVFADLLVHFLPPTPYTLASLSCSIRFIFTRQRFSHSAGGRKPTP